VVILTALELEYRAVLQVSASAEEGTQWIEAKSPLGLPVAFRVFRARNRRMLRVAVTRVEAGTPQRGEALQALLESYRPACIALAGVCEGRPGKTGLGDVIIADRLFPRDTGAPPAEAVPQGLAAWGLRDDWKLELERFDFVSRLRNGTWWSQRPVPFEWQENWLLWKLFIGVEDPGRHPECETFCPQYGKVLKALWNSGHVVRPELTLTEQGRARLVTALQPLRNKFPDLAPGGSDLPFTVHVAPIALGGPALEDAQGWDTLAAHGRKTLGLERNAAVTGALAQAWQGRSDRQFDLLVMKGVADLDPLGRNDASKTYAARASAECLITFLREDLSVDVLPDVDDLLVSGTDPLPEDPPPSALLAARYEVVPFLEKGCAGSLAELDRWCDSEPALATRLLHAEPGVGKTRLAIHWIRRRIGMGWAAGFLPRTLPDTWFERLWNCRRPVLLVIDNAELYPGLQAVLQRALQRYREDARGVLHRLRILLLARSHGEWWQALRKKDEALGLWLDTTPLQELKPLPAEEATRNGSFYAAADAYARYLKLPAVEEPPPLNDARFDRMLNVHMAALATVENVPFAPDTLTERVLGLEERFWTSHALIEREDAARTERQRALVREVMAAAMLRGGLLRFDDASALAARLLGGEPSNEDKDTLRRLNRIYARTRGGAFLPPLEPELLGEKLVLRVAAEPREGARPADWIDRVYVPEDDPRALVSGLEVFGRASALEPEAARPWIEWMLAGPLKPRTPLALEAIEAAGLSGLLQRPAHP